MTLSEFSVYSIAKDAAKASGVFTLNGREIAKDFGGGVSKSGIYAVIKRLLKKGWLKQIDAPARGYWGFFGRYQFRLVSHMEWVQKHPGLCREKEDQEHGLHP